MNETSQATEAQREVLRDLCAEMAGAIARHIGQHVGREVKVVAILSDEEDEEIYTGCYDIGRDYLLALLDRVSETARSGDCRTRVMVNGEVVADREGKPS